MRLTELYVIALFLFDHKLHNWHHTTASIQCFVRFTRVREQRLVCVGVLGLDRDSKMLYLTLHLMHEYPKT